jgi:Domain of unknown function (DUF4157)
MTYATLSRRVTSAGEHVVTPPRPAGHPAAGPAGRLRPSQIPARPSAVPPQEILGVLRGPSQPLATPLREEMESRLGADLADVRVHTGAAASASAAGLGARAYTAGRHVVIGEAGADRRTLVHELVHVLQQRQGPVTATGSGAGLRISDPSDGFEQQAEAVAGRAAPGVLPAGPGGSSATRQEAPAAPATETAVPPVQRTLIINGIQVNSTNGLPNVKNDGGKPATDPSFFDASQETWKKRLGNRARNSDAKKAWLAERFKALEDLIVDKNYIVELPTLEDVGNKLRREVLNYYDYQRKPEAAPVTEALAARQPGGKEPESKEEKLPEIYHKLAATGRVFPGDELMKVARKAAEEEPGFRFELELAAEALGADKDSRVQLGAMGMSSISDYLPGELAQHEKQKATGRVGADVVVWRPVSSPGKQPEPAVTQYGATFIQAKAIKFSSLKAEVTKAKNQLEGTNASGKGTNVRDREITLSGRDYRGVIALSIWDGVTDIKELKNVAQSALQSDYVHEVDVRDLMARERLVFTLKDGQLSQVDSKL